MSGTVDPPTFSLADARALAAREFGVEAAAAPLPSTSDQNFLLTTAAGEQFVLKIANAAEPAPVLAMQNAALQHLATRPAGLALPRRLPARTGTAMAAIADGRGRVHQARLVSFVGGRTLASLGDVTPALRRDLGACLARLDLALRDFDHPGARRALSWDLAQAAWIAPHLEAIEEPEVRALAAAALATFRREVEPRWARLRQAVVHGDANDHNVLLAGSGVDGWRIHGLIDFGDMVRTALVAEVAIAGAYACLEQPDPLDAIADVVAGYHAVLPLEDLELEVLVPLVATRLSVSITSALLAARARPGERYLQVTAGPARTALRALALLPPRLAHYNLRAACGLEACAATPALVAWLGASVPFAPVLTPDPRTARLCWLDCNVGSAELGLAADYADTAKFARTIADRLAAADAGLGIGSYGEVRPFYSTDAFREAGNEGPQWRTRHLGVDLFAPAGTAVHAPLDGVVHSLADNAARLDYGPTVVLEHVAPASAGAAAGLPFHTLYGHLARSSLERLRPGQRIDAGEPFAAIGAPPENGDWPPHVHLQLVTDMLGRRGDFAGAARPDQWDLWRSLCPDPGPLLGLPPRPAPAPLDERELLAARRAHLGPNLSLHYRRPLHVVRGQGQFLFAADGRRYLDAVNNVAHVGHCHPRVVRAGQQQMAVLNTNSRYLHEHLVRYAERLAALLPPPLSVVWFTCSGSEANELALRIARAVTGGHETIALEGAYHGNTNALVEISPYSSTGRAAGRRRRSCTRCRSRTSTAAITDGDDAGARHAEHVAAAVAAITARGARPTFVCESLMGSAGQVPLAPGYLAAAYAHVRAAGGVCIADEVQTGFGRIGTHIFGFQSHGVVPDLVTLGKPIGNGHPLGAVITTPAIAAQFCNGMEYFNTFGGNPVSCAIGLAVLDVLRDEDLQANALRQGTRLLAGLRALQQQHAIVGDVRGSGLFLGVEFVEDRATKARATAAATAVVNRMRELSVLVSADANCLKIKPPMVFTDGDAEFLLATLDRALAGL